MDVLCVFVACVIACVIQVVTAGEYCAFTLKYCYYGCCGTECCVDHDIQTIFTIVGGVVGGLVFINLIIAVVCILVKHTCRPKSAVNPATTATGTNHHQQGYIKQRYPPVQTSADQASNPAFPPMQQLYPPLQPVPGQTGDPAFPPLYPERDAYGHPLNAPPPYPGQPQNVPGHPAHAPSPAKY